MRGTSVRGRRVGKHCVVRYILLRSGKKKNVVPSSKRPGGPMIYSIIYSQQVTQILRYVFSCKEGATIDLLVPSVGVCFIPNLSQK